jgi:hypothetical protein
MKCSKWKLAIITELINGNNGLVRAAKIRMNEIETTRPIVKIYLLEVTMNTFSQEKSVGYAYTNPLQQQEGTIRKQFT